MNVALHSLNQDNLSIILCVILLLYVISTRSYQTFSTHKTVNKINILMNFVWPLKIITNISINKFVFKWKYKYVYNTKMSFETCRRWFFGVVHNFSLFLCYWLIVSVCKESFRQNSVRSDHFHCFFKSGSFYSEVIYAIKLFVVWWSKREVGKGDFYN